MTSVFLVQASDYDEGYVVGVYATREEADAECVRINAAYDRFDKTHTKIHSVEERVLGASSMRFLVRVNAQGDVTDVHVSSYPSSQALGPRSYAEVHDDGSAYDAFGATYEDALRMAQDAASAGVPIPENP